MKGYIDLTTLQGRQKFYQSKEWRAIRMVVLINQPYCVECEKTGIYERATEVDHIVDIKDDRNRCLDTTNLQSLCKKCHSKKTYQTSYWFKKTSWQVVNIKWKGVH